MESNLIRQAYHPMLAQAGLPRGLDYVQAASRELSNRARCRSEPEATLTGSSRPSAWFAARRRQKMRHPRAPCRWADRSLIF